MNFFIIVLGLNYVYIMIVLYRGDERMVLIVGIVGLLNVGKLMLFNVII